MLKSNDKLEHFVRISDNTTSVMSTLASSLKEADSRVAPYASHTIDNGYKRGVIV